MILLCMQHVAVVLEGNYRLEPLQAEDTQAGEAEVLVVLDLDVVDKNTVISQNNGRA